MPTVDVPSLLTQSAPFAIPLLSLIVGFLLGRIRDRHSTRLSRETERLAEVRSAAVECISAARRIRKIERSEGYIFRWMRRGLKRAQGQETESTEEERAVDNAKESLGHSIARLTISAPDLVDSAYDLWDVTNKDWEEWEAALDSFSQSAADHLMPPRWATRLQRKAKQRRLKRKLPGITGDPTDSEGTESTAEDASIISAQDGKV